MDYKNKDSRSIADRIGYVVSSIAIRLASTAANLATREGREILRGPYKRALYDRKYQSGFFVRSIIQNPLYFPSDSESSLRYEEAVAGRFVGYDFHRKEELGHNIHDQLKKRKDCKDES